MVLFYRSTSFRLVMIPGDFYKNDDKYNGFN